ncbi:caspase family protein [Pseudomonas marginalis]|uniref:Peptidase C14 caspase domain-containing protein n=2 Tax=Pseudomonas marginalis TaxID=298 RepID=A0A3M4AXU9_PSEMA|nr:caspase family protein [Pseudomonas marginalis]OAJ47771.1 hypothetical protein AO064_25770 [Pseudomonas marginalis]RMO62623.1 hypothetical protein ALQ38_03948 [Pseudomonas marginalis pv. marginalis]RMP11651.1 hypothetical protein ALQ29_03910 [Pseudomonas marginalis pv. marginalis]
MGLNVAILLGVTDYIDAHNQLPACKNDIEVMAEVLEATRKFNDIFVVPSENGQALKALLAEHIAKFKGQEIDELFFYFTGHGDFRNDEFRFLLRDYSIARPAQTSLSNDELDNFLRSLSPKVVIKVVDACHSGMPYIKDGGSFAEYMKAATEATFDKCYFLFSSQSDQASWASRNISDFTKILAESVAESAVDSIRYKDILDYISDAFIADPKQRPMFVVQGDFTEVFGVFAKHDRESLKARLGAVNKGSVVKDSGRTKSLAELIKEASKEYVTMETALKALSDLKSNLENVSVPNSSSEIFEMTTNFYDEFKVLPNKSTLGKWLTKSEGEYFASPEYDTETYEVDSPMSRAFGGIMGANHEKITRTRKVISGVQTSMADLPFLACRIIFTPKYPNITQYSAWLTYFISKKDIQLFYCFVDYKEINWGKYRMSEISEWSTFNTSLTTFDGGKTVSETFLNAFENFVSTNLAVKLGVNLEAPKPDEAPKPITKPKTTQAKPQ